MKIKFTLLTLVVATLSSVSLSAQNYDVSAGNRNDRYDGHWPKGEGILYSYKDGLIIGTFSNGKAEGKCICYKPNGEVYWGDYKKGRQTGYGRIYRDNGIVMAGQYKNGKYHGTDTLYRSNGSVIVGKFKKGKLKNRIAEIDSPKDPKPEYPRVDLHRKQEEFLKELELIWEDRNIRLREMAGLTSPKFQGGSIDDFALCCQSQQAFQGAHGFICRFLVTHHFQFCAAVDDGHGKGILNAADIFIKGAEYGYQIFHPLGIDNTFNHFHSSVSSPLAGIGLSFPCSYRSPPDGKGHLPR